MEFRLLTIDRHSPMYTGIRGRCPRCGEGKLFSGLLKIAAKCESCSLDYSFADPADGPAFFVMSVTGTLAVALLFILQMTTPLPDWLILAVVGLALTGLSIAMLVPIKGWLVNSQFYYKAGEGELAGPVSSAPCGCENCRLRYARVKRAA